MRHVILIFLRLENIFFFFLKQPPPQFILVHTFKNTRSFSYSSSVQYLYGVEDRDIVLKQKKCMMKHCIQHLVSLL